MTPEMVLNMEEEIRDLRTEIVQLKKELLDCRQLTADRLTQMTIDCKQSLEWRDKLVIARLALEKVSFGYDSDVAKAVNRALERIA